MPSSFFTILLLFILSFSALGEEHYHIVKKGETLSDILYQKNIRPLYGKRGAVKKALILNPNIIASQGDKLFPGMRIRLIYRLPANDYVSEKQLEIVIEKPVAEIPLLSDRAPGDDFNQSFYWELAPSLSWKNISSTDENVFSNSKIDALTDMNYGIDLTYVMHFSEDVDVYSSLSLELVRFMEDKSISLVKKNFLATRFNMGVLYNKKWTFEIGMNDEFFLTSPGASRVEVKKVALPEIKSGYRNDFYQYRNAKLRYLLSATAVLPKTTPDVNSKLGFGFGAGIEANLKNQSFVIGYDIKYLKASGNSTDNHNIFWNYIWKTQ